MENKISKSIKSVQDVLERKGVKAKIVELPGEARTAQQAADALGTKVAQIVKSLIFKTKHTHKPILVLVSGINRVNEKLIEEQVQEEIVKADPAFVRKVTGFAIGGVSPIGHAEEIETFIDRDLLAWKDLWAAAGAPHAVFNLVPESLKWLTGGKVIAIN